MSAAALLLPGRPGRRNAKIRTLGATTSTAPGLLRTHREVDQAPTPRFASGFSSVAAQKFKQECLRLILVIYPIGSPHAQI